MGKGHRDNHAARVKRGKVAFDKKAERREPEFKCNLCGRICREVKLVAGICPVCVARSA
jgi:rubrerythrin